MDALLPHPLPRPRHTRTSRRGPHLPPAPRPHPTRTRTRSGDGLSKTCFTDDAAVVVPNGADGAPFEGEWLPRGGLSLVEKLEHFPGSVGWARMLVKDHSAVGHEFPGSLEWSLELCYDGWEGPYEEWREKEEERIRKKEEEAVRPWCVDVPAPSSEPSDGISTEPSIFPSVSVSMEPTDLGLPINLLYHLLMSLPMLQRRAQLLQTCVNLNIKKRCLRKDCYWTDKKCSSCSKITKDEPCLKNGCVWNPKKGGKCSSCNDTTKGNTCRRKGCVWKEGTCSSCCAKSNKKKCDETPYTWLQKICVSCAEITEKKQCKKINCKWNKIKGCTAPLK